MRASVEGNDLRVGGLIGSGEEGLSKSQDHLRSGPKTAIVTVADAILVSVPPRRVRARLPGPRADYYDRRHADWVRHRAIQTLKRQG
jgi:hypothetical protein